jgi:hypothetical protein
MGKGSPGLVSSLLTGPWPALNTEASAHPKPHSGLSPPHLPPCLLPPSPWPSLCNSPCNSSSLPDCGPWRAGTKPQSVPCTLSAQEMVLELRITPRRPRGRKSARPQGERKEGWLGAESPTLRAWPSFATSLVTGGLGRHSNMAILEGSESPTGEGQLWPSRKPRLREKG